MSEIKIHKRSVHENIVKFEHVFEDENNVYILLELCANESLSDLMKKKKRLQDKEVRELTMQLVRGLQYLHQ